MPAVSKAQFRLMAGICKGEYPSGYRGIPKKVACEFVNKTKNVKSLPNRVGGKKRGRRKARRKIRASKKRRNRSR